jgi:acyl carrier protein
MSDTDTLIQIVREVAQNDVHVDASTQLVAELGFDSLDIAEMIVLVEQHFGLEIDVRKFTYEQLWTVHEWVGVVVAARNGVAS